jgi:hypothetical protein
MANAAALVSFGSGAASARIGECYDFPEHLLST